MKQRTLEVKNTHVEAAVEAHLKSLSLINDDEQVVGIRRANMKTYIATLQVEDKA